MIAAQGGRCLICQEETKLHVDHCHETKKVRGLLCRECNTGLGKFKERVDLLERAIHYLA
jgi:protein-arginine kinase activator protein McsA